MKEGLAAVASLDIGLAAIASIELAFLIWALKLSLHGDIFFDPRKFQPPKKLTL